jgi:hypothetical protein
MQERIELLSIETAQNRRKALVDVAVMLLDLMTATCGLGQLLRRTSDDRRITPQCSSIRSLAAIAGNGSFSAMSPIHSLLTGTLTSPAAEPPAALTTRG